MSQKIIVSVISDLVTDQRVQKECRTLHQMGYEVVLIGRKTGNPVRLEKMGFHVVRLRVPFGSGPLMYFFFNVQLFFYLLFRKADVLWANDLDTLLANFLIWRVKKCKLVYDSHEYFTLSVTKNTSRKVWERLENYIFPKLKNVITVNGSIASAYKKKYHVPVTVIRNLPYERMPEIRKGVVELPDKKILIMQGMGLNENRGTEEAVLTMQYLPDEFMLYFIGGGTMLTRLKQMTRDLGLSRKIIFVAALPYDEMMEYTRQCFLGLIFEKIDVTDHHRFALPNKLFDYLKAGLPILSSKAPEIELLINQYQVGDVIDCLDPPSIARKILAVAQDMETYHEWQRHTREAIRVLNWENEEKTLVQFMARLT